MLRLFVSVGCIVGFFVSVESFALPPAEPSFFYRRYTRPLNHSPSQGDNFGYAVTIMDSAVLIGCPGSTCIGNIKCDWRQKCRPFEHDGCYFFEINPYTTANKYRAEHAKVLLNPLRMTERPRRGAIRHNIGYAVAAFKNEVLVIDEQGWEPEGTEEGSGGTDQGRIHVILDPRNANWKIPITIRNTLHFANQLEHYGQALAVTSSEVFDHTNRSVDEKLDPNGYVVFVGTPGKSNAATSKREGVVYAYKMVQEEGKWKQLPGNIRSASNPQNQSGLPAAGEFGCALALAGDKLLVSARHNRDAKNEQFTGAVYILDNSMSVLDAVYGKINGNSFGWSVAGRPGAFLVGDPDGDHGTKATNVGAAHLFSLDPNNKAAFVTTIKPPHPELNSRFGIAVAFAGDMIVVGAPGQTFNASGLRIGGAVYLFDASGQHLLQEYYGPVGGNLGYSLAANTDWILAGSPIESLGGFNDYAYLPAPDNIKKGTISPVYPHVGSAYLFRIERNILDPDIDDDWARQWIGSHGSHQINEQTQEDLVRLFCALLDGSTGDDDERAMLKVIQCLPCIRVRDLVSKIGWTTLNKAFDGEEWDELVLILASCKVIDINIWDDDATRLFIDRAQCQTINQLTLVEIRQLMLNLFDGSAGDEDEVAIISIFKCLTPSQRSNLLRMPNMSLDDFDDVVDGSEWIELKALVSN